MVPQLPSVGQIPSESGVWVQAKIYHQEIYGVEVPSDHLSVAQTCHNEACNYFDWQNLIL